MTGIRCSQAGGEMGRLIRSHDWASTTLGSPETWPHSLRTAVSIMLGSRYAMWMAWGSDLTFFCNDAYRPTLGIKASWALGARSDQVWDEVWDAAGPRIRSVLETGIATWDEDLLLLLERSGYPEETYHTFSYSPLRDDRGLGRRHVVRGDRGDGTGHRRAAARTLRQLADATVRPRRPRRRSARAVERRSAPIGATCRSACSTSSMARRSSARLVVPPGSSPGRRSTVDHRSGRRVPLVVRGIVREARAPITLEDLRWAATDRRLA